MIFFFPNLNVRNERKTKPETIKAQTDAENPYKIKETSNSIANGDAKKMRTAAGYPSKMNSSQRQFPNKNRPPKAQERPNQTPKKSRSPTSAIHPWELHTRSYPKTPRKLKNDRIRHVRNLEDRLRQSTRENSIHAAVRRLHESSRTTESDT